jgi:diaminohydroxyphosphoribosylaminopyrimidine deaminase / 5-amino-6-(5-phosphoribosylamino)uracil reductase
MTAIDRQFMQRAVRLAMNGRGAVEPNPMVGCVIVKDGQVIGEGFHERFGGPHAEPNALAACKQSANGASAYVTLEPCCHTRKKTPPCVPLLIESKLARVIVGCRDPNPFVAGRGMEQLRAAGIEVNDADDSSCRQLIAPFVASVVHHRPYVTLKWAQTADGKVAGASGKRVQIANAASMHLVHQLRATSDAILVGIGTARNDNPQLIARGVKSSRPLIRMVLDSDLRLSVDSRLAKTARDGHAVIVFCSKEGAEYSGTRAPLAALGVEIRPLSSTAPGRLDLQQMLRAAGTMGITHLLVEPGPTLAASFLQQGLADRIWVFRSPRAIDEPTAPAATNVPYPSVAQADVQGDQLSEYLNPASPLFFAAEPSADFVMAAGGASHCA